MKPTTPRDGSECGNKVETHTFVTHDVYHSSHKRHQRYRRLQGVRSRASLQEALLAVSPGSSIIYPFTRLLLRMTTTHAATAINAPTDIYKTVLLCFLLLPSSIGRRLARTRSINKYIQQLQVDPQGHVLSFSEINMWPSYALSPTYGIYILSLRATNTIELVQSSLSSPCERDWLWG